MSAQIFSFPGRDAIVSQLEAREAIISKLKAAEAELQLVVEEESASDLWSVIERLQEIILKIQSRPGRPICWAFFDILCSLVNRLGVCVLF
jgi:hypothetical protein